MYHFLPTTTGAIWKDSDAYCTALITTTTTIGQTTAVQVIR